MERELPIRNAGLYSALRNFISVALGVLREHIAAGDEPSFSVDAHREAAGTPGLYEYQPLVEQYVISHAEQLKALPQADEAAWVVASDPAASAWLRAGRAGVLVELEVAARDEVLFPLLCRIAESTSDFGFDEDVVLEAYLRLERAIYEADRRYMAAVPLHGVRLAAGDLKLANGVRVRQLDPELFRMEWPDAARLNWGRDGNEGLPGALLEFERLVGEHDDGSGLDPLPALDQFVSAVRALAGGAIHAGPYVLERFDFRTLAPRPVSALAAVSCADVTTTIDSSVAQLLPTALRRLAAQPRGRLVRALERYQIAAGTGGASSLRLLLDALTDIYAEEGETSAAALRLAAVVGASLAERRQVVESMNTAAVAVRESRTDDDETRLAVRTLASGLRATLAAALVGELPLSHVRAYADGVLLGEQDRRHLAIAGLDVVPTA